ncbi:hypothetical protein AOQ84DRAFT_438953 [Glonium stellatum]|uniref:UBA domain-containing protein n=1 Tax=Glonium stellatum TaxID=574774 RepID=A0A8E2F2Z1_9PEZI|nr:hypothetical protein AOQ84DRAFT_438953 [Glonium stellatum]
MDDLSGLDWTSTTSNNTKPPSSFYPPLRQSPAPPLSGRSTPLSAQPSGHGLKASSKPTTPSNDSFSGLLSLNPSKALNNLSLQERQKQLLAEKERQEAERKKQYDSQFGTHDTHFWESLGNGKATPSAQKLANNGSRAHNLSKTINKPFAGLDTSSKRPNQASSNEDGLLSAFSSDAPVDASTHFPIPQPIRSGQSGATFVTSTSRGQEAFPQSIGEFGDDDDPFGLTQNSQRRAGSTIQPLPVDNDEDDILGMLGKPVSEFIQLKGELENLESINPEAIEHTNDPTTNPRDKAIADLVDMGFPPEKSALALAQTESGTDIQAAVGWLLNQAHNEAKQKAQIGRENRGRQSPLKDSEAQQRNDSRHSEQGARSGPPVPAWKRGEESRPSSTQPRQDNRSPGGEKDVTQYASEIGSTIFKSANTLWKTGQKKVQKAVAEFQQEGDSQPKWMRNARTYTDGEDLSYSPEKASRGDTELSNASGNRRAKTAAPQSSVTDEALMLESSISRPQKLSHLPGSNSTLSDSSATRTRHNPDLSDFSVLSHPSTQPRFSQKQVQQPDQRPAAKLTRQDVEEQTARAYVSPARRKLPTAETAWPTSEPQKSSSVGSGQSTPSQSNNPFFQQNLATISRKSSSSSIVTRPKPSPRQVPPTSSSALSTSAFNRQKGSDAFKRGDYPAAHSAYSAALAPLPKGHPLTIIIFCNRALTNIRVGEPKAAISDADSALASIGASRGEGEKILLGDNEGEKDMKEFFGKALMRKAEALEHMEKWADAAKVWKQAVEAGVGGSISIQGRNRCESAAGGTKRQTHPTVTARPASNRRRPPKTSALDDLTGSLNSAAASEAEAVKKLREANAAAEKADDEKFALTDQVDAKLIAWKGSKSDNLRALLGSLDTVLWPEAGWSKVGMSDLVMPNKVKIVYMKAIAKVHPDKIPQTASTEQRMISGAVFSTLNEAWDKFKRDNGL